MVERIRTPRVNGCPEQDVRANSLTKLPRASFEHLSWKCRHETAICVGELEAGFGAAALLKYHGDMREGEGDEPMENMLLSRIGYWPVKLKIGLLSPEKVGKATVL